MPEPGPAELRSVTLTKGIGDAYTPTIVDGLGMVCAINNAILFAVGK